MMRQKPPKLTLDKLNSREKRSKKETKTPPTVAPWRGSDPVPKDTWRFNVLENDEGVKDVQKIRELNRPPRTEICPLATCEMDGQGEGGASHGVITPSASLSGFGEC
ncbi:hypothetical protein ACOMHN_039429 [Nucella lapillus]